MELFNHIFSQSQHILVISSINGHFAIFGNLLKFIAIFRNFIIILMKGPKSTFCRRALTELLSTSVILWSKTYSTTGGTLNLEFPVRRYGPEKFLTHKTREVGPQNDDFSQMTSE